MYQTKRKNGNHIAKSLSLFSFRYY